MPTGWILINAEVGSEADVFKELKRIEEVQEIYSTYGVYDIIAKVTADTMDKLKDVITWKVRRLNKVKSTLTMVVAEE